jgi:hypothetical protein
MIHIRRPEMRNRILQRKEKRNRNRKREPAPARQPVKHIFIGLVLVHHKGLTGPSVDEADEEDAHNGSVGEINRKAIAAEPHEHFVAEDVLQCRREPDADDGDVPAERGPAFGVAGRSGRENVVANICQLLGPVGPVCTLAWVAGHVDADNKTESLNDAPRTRPACDKFLEIRVRADITEQDTPEELALKCFWIEVRIGGL